MKTAVWLLLTLLLFGCKREEPSKPDTQKPTLSFLRSIPAGSPLVLRAEQIATLFLKATDNKNLALLQAFIKQDFMSPNRFSSQQSQTISGTEAEIAFQLTMPAIAESGTYVIKFVAKDQAGNTSDTLIVGFELQNGNDLQNPTLTITQPTQNQTINPGDSLSIVAKAEDNLALRALQISFEMEETGFNPLDELFIELNGQKSVQVLQKVRIPINCPKGVLVLRGQLSDQKLNVSSKVIKIKVL